MPWIPTVSGEAFDLANPDAAQVDICDIAHALSLQCRFAGHVREHYSVATHSMHVATSLAHLGAEAQLAGLLHDAHEAYMGDIVGPLKLLLATETDMLRRLELGIQETILQALCGSSSFSELYAADIKLADRVLLATERRDLLPFCNREWQELPNPAPFVVTPEPAPAAARRFLRTYKVLCDLVGIGT